MDFSAILAQSEVVVLVFLLLCFVGLLLIFYITYRALSNLREELQNQLDIASARLERLERAMNASAAAALSETQGAQSLGELLDDEAPEPAPEPRQETGPRGAPKAVGSEVCAEPVSERAESPRQKHIDTEELALLEAEALSGQLREGIFAASATGAVSARTAWDEEEDAEASTPAAPPIPEEETDWSEIDLSETAIEFDDADLEDEEEPPAGTAAPELESEDADAHELLLDLSEEGDDARLGSTMDFEEEGAFGSLDESLDSDEMEGDEIAAANEWSEPLETEEELAFDGTIDFEDISEDDIAVAEAMHAPDSRQREVQLTLDEPVSESMVDELSLGDALVLDELEELGPAPESAAESGELEGEISLDEDLIFEEADEPASAAPSSPPESAAEGGELEGEISLDEDLIFEESDEPASAAPSSPPESAAEAGELEGEISLDEDLIFEEADEPASAAPSSPPESAAEGGELEGEISLDEALIFEEADEPASAAPSSPPESAAEGGELEGEISLDEALIFEEADEPASAAPSPAPESAAEGGELEGEISLDEALIFEESDEPASAAPSPAPESAAEAGELEGEISLDEDLIFEESDEPASAAPSLSTAEPVVKGPAHVAPFTMSGDEDDDLVFEGLDKGFAPESGESEGAEHKEPSLAGAMLLDEEGGGEAESPELEDRVEAAGGAKPSKRIVSIEDDDYEFDNPSETMILLDEDMGPARRAFVEEEDDAEGEEIGGQALFEELEREGGPAEEFAAASPETLFWTGDDDAPIYFGDEDDAETIAQPFVSQAQDVTAEHPARETAGSLAVDETPVESEEPVQQRHPVLDETVPEPEAEGLDLDVEMALNETFLEEDLLYLEGLMKDTREEAGNTGDAVRKPAASTTSTREPAGYSGGAKSADPLGDDDIVFEDIGELDAVDVVEPFEPSAGEGSFADEDSEDFMLEEENIEFGMPISPGSSAAPYLSGDDDIFFEDATEAEAVRPPVSYEAKIEPLHGGDAGTGGSEADDDIVIDFEQDIAALEDMLDQTKKKPNDE